MKVELTPELVADIKQKAEAAQELAPGTWHGGPDGDHWVLVDSQRGVFHTTCKERNIAEFIAYADPVTVLAMIARIRQLEEQVAVLSKIERDRWLQTAKLLGIKPEDVGYGQG